MRRPFFFTITIPTRTMPSDSSAHLFPLAMLAVAAVWSIATPARGDAQPDNSLDIPAATAYLQPHESGTRVSPEGITRWTDPQVRIKWYGQLKKVGQLSASVLIRPLANREFRLRLRLEDQTREASVTGKTDEVTEVEFGSFTIDKLGYQSFELSSLDDDPACAVQLLRLRGPAVTSFKGEVIVHG